MADQNGKQNEEKRRQLGRRAPLPPLFTFPDSGVTVGLYRTSPETLASINREVNKLYPIPPPPSHMVPVGEAGEMVEEVNEADPAYPKLLYEHALKTSHEIGSRLLKLAIRQMILEIDEEAWETYKADMADINSPIDDTDLPFQARKSLYVRHLVITSDKDLNSLMNYLLSQSQPTEAAVQEYKDQFPSEVRQEERVDDRTPSVVG